MEFTLAKQKSFNESARRGPTLCSVALAALT